MPHPAILPDIQTRIDNTDNHPLKDFAVIHSQPVEWGEMDAFGHVNNVIYYNYAQNARIHYNEQLGLFDEHTLSVLAASSCQYLKPVVYPDTLWIGVRIKNLGNTSIVHEYTYYSATQQCLVAKGESVLVYLDRETQQKKPIDDAKKQAIAALEGW